MIVKLNLETVMQMGLKQISPLLRVEMCWKSTLETLVEEAGLNVKESEVLEEYVDIALEVVNAGSDVFKAVNLMPLAVLTVWFTMIPTVRFALNILKHLCQFVVLFL